MRVESQKLRVESWGTGLAGCCEDILLGAVAGKRLSGEDGILLFKRGGLAELGLAADAICRRLHPEPYRTYVIDRNINYTNICDSGCRFCAFFRSPGDLEGYVLSTAGVLKKIQEAVDLGATQILMQGGLNPDLRIEFFEDLFRAIKKRFSVQIHSLSAPEICYIAKISDLDIDTTVRRLADSGLDSLPGGGAEILSDRVRAQLSPNKASTFKWLSVMRSAAKAGLRATATMMFGHIETIEERVDHLLAIRDLQDETLRQAQGDRVESQGDRVEAQGDREAAQGNRERGCGAGLFTAFIPWTYQPGNTDLRGHAVGGHDYLKTLAISRIMLDNIQNIQASWVTQGAGVAQVALAFGANDIGSTMIEENVVAAAGVTFRMSEQELIDLIRGAGYEPAQRDTLYRLVR